MLVTMATPISSHVKDKNSIFTAGVEDMIFFVKGIYTINNNIQPGPKKGVDCSSIDVFKLIAANLFVSKC